MIYTYDISTRMSTGYNLVYSYTYITFISIISYTSIQVKQITLLSKPNGLTCKTINLIKVVKLSNEFSD